MTIQIKSGYKFPTKKDNDEILSKSRVFISATIVSFSSMIVGLCITTFRTFTKSLDDNEIAKKRKLDCEIILSDIEMKILIFIFTIGGLISTFGLGVIKGHTKKKIFLANILCFIGNSFLYISSGFKALILGKLFIGLTTGITYIVVPQYLCVISPVHIRGSISGFHPTGIAIGTFLGSIISYLYPESHQIKNRTLGIMILAVFNVIFILFIENTDKIYDDQEYSVSLKTLVLERRARKSILTTFVLHTGLHLSCIYLTCFFLENMVNKDQNVNLLFLNVCLVSVIGEILSIFIIEKIGRKFLIISSLFIIISGLIMLIYSGFTMLSLYIYVLGFNIGLGPMAWIITCEIYPIEFIFAGTVLGVCFNWLANILVSLTFPALYNLYGKKCFLVYIISLVCISFYFIFEFSETKGQKRKFQ